MKAFSVSDALGQALPPADPHLRKNSREFCRVNEQGLRREVPSTRNRGRQGVQKGSPISGEN